jgi:glycosyltransferase involved in cell wall biosynthesis
MKTRVLIVSHAYVVGVNQQKVEALSQDKNLEITLLTPTTWKAPLRETSLEKTSDPNYLIKSFSPIASGNNDRFFFPPLRVLKLIRDFKPDIIHVEEEPWSLSLIEFMLLGKIFGAKIVFFTWENLSRAHRPWYRVIEKLNFGMADMAIAGNTEAKEILQKKGFHKPITVLPQLGVDPHVFKKTNADLLKKKLGLRSFVFGSFARLEEQKGIKQIISAFRGLKETNISLLLVGSGPLLNEIQQLSIEDPRIIAPGVVPHANMPEYFNLLDVFILASQTTPVWKEQFGHVLIEAMATEVPVIGSTSGAIPEVIGESGLIFKEGDSQDLKVKMEKLLKDKKLYQRLAKKGLERVTQHYTQEIIASHTIQIYKQLLKS